MDKYCVDIDGKERIDCFLSEMTGKTRSHFNHLVDSGNISINGQIVSKSGTKVKRGDEVCVNEPEAVEVVEKKDIPIDIIYQDSEIAVINKQQGLTVHPSSGNYDNTLVNGLMFHLDSLSGINGEIRPGIVHRLDKDTSGIMMIAKNDNAHLSLSKQIENRTVTKIYLAVLEGNLKADSGEIINKIGRNPKDRKSMAITFDGRDAITRYKVIERYKNNCLVAFRILTGRTHQIRVHAQSLLHPVVGDRVYGYKKQRFNLNGQLLHAYKLGFTHPTSGEKMLLKADLPQYFIEVLDIIAKESGKNTPTSDIIDQLTENID